MELGERLRKIVEQVNLSGRRVEDTPDDFEIIPIDEVVQAIVKICEDEVRHKTIDNGLKWKTDVTYLKEEIARLNDMLKADVDMINRYIDRCKAYEKALQEIVNNCHDDKPHKTIKDSARRALEGK